MEFAGFRQYTYGDDASRIDWNATLRAKEVLVREFEEYKTVNVLFLLDVSESMLWASCRKLKCEFAAELLFNMTLAIIDAGNNVGYVMFSDRIYVKNPPGLGHDIAYRLARDLSNGNNYGGKRDFAKTMALINAFLRQRTLIIIMSDFIGMPQGWERYIKMFSMRNDLIALMIRDPHDYDLPAAGLQAVVRDPYSDETLLIDLKQYASIFAAEVKAEEAQVARVFEKVQSGFLKLDTTKDPFDPLVLYFRKRVKMLKG
jgi:uncharacterized protein (DUF58 family)